ncbi:hypothetical protein WJX75_005850 [Coccomyxa subellipsoidea]|uniref:Uncharacterized protein n=1 Tax=Coccomyxa subellipsoidea TaxID=248742 RepID=A0ABR2YE03_9CHLO
MVTLEGVESGRDPHRTSIDNTRALNAGGDRRPEPSAHRRGDDANGAAFQPLPLLNGLQPYEFAWIGVPAIRPARPDSSELESA